MKKIILLVLALMLALSLVACGNNISPLSSSNNSTSPPTSNDDGDTTPNDYETSEATDYETSEATKEAIRPPASAELSSEWNSFQFELEGIIYTLPVSYSELEANGWVVENDEDMDETLKAGQYTITYTSMVNSNKENSEVSVQFANLGEENLPMRECYVCGIQFTEYSWSENTVLYFPGGFTIGSTMEEVKALYGEPSEIHDYSATVEWKYQTQIYDDVIFTFTKETGIIEKMRMLNIYLP